MLNISSSPLGSRIKARLEELEIRAREREDNGSEEPEDSQNNSQWYSSTDDSAPNNASLNPAASNTSEANLFENFPPDNLMGALDSGVSNISVSRCALFRLIFTLRRRCSYFAVASVERMVH